MTSLARRFEPRHPGRPERPSWGLTLEFADELQLGDVPSGPGLALRSGRKDKEQPHGGDQRETIGKPRYPKP